MKIVKMKQPTRHPEFISGSAHNGHDAADSRQALKQVQGDWQYQACPPNRPGKQQDKWSYQGKRPDQVESSYKIFAFSILAALTLALFALLFGL